MNKPYKIALCQMTPTKDKDQNHRRAAKAVAEAARSGAGVVCLPEIWNAPYDLKLLRDYAEPEGGPSFDLMARMASENKIYLIGGTIPEEAGNAEATRNAEDFRDTVSDENAESAGGAAAAGRLKVYNTSYVFDPNGGLIAKHRKTRLFDVDIEGGLRFKESDFFSAGEGVTVFDTVFGKMGLAICFEVRFPELFREMNKAGAHIVFVPAAFNINTGAAHWDILMKSRALDNQMYIAACAPARDLTASFTTWGHSCVATPWGEYCAAADARETIVYAEIDRGYLNKVRREIPIGN